MRSTLSRSIVTLATSRKNVAWEPLAEIVTFSTMLAPRKSSVSKPLPPSTTSLPSPGFQMKTSSPEPRSARSDMDQEAADELVNIERHQLVAGIGLGAVILPFERHALAIKGDEPAVRNSNPVGVAGQVGKDSVGSAKRPLGIDHPFDLSQCGNVGFEACWLG